MNPERTKLLACTCCDRATPSSTVTCPMHAAAANRRRCNRSSGNCAHRYRRGCLARRRASV